MSRLREIAATVREHIPEARIEAYRDLGSDVLVCEADQVVGVLTVLRDACRFEMVSDISATDWLPREPRYDVNYHLASLTHEDRLRVKVQLEDAAQPRLPSARDVWKGAEWHEREVYDFFGVVFSGHPDLRRVFMPEEWIGHPLRKDYPVGGVPVEYKIEPAYVGEYTVSEEGRPAAGGLPMRLHHDRGRPSHWTWSGPPSAGVRNPRRPDPPQEEPQTEPGADEPSEEGEEPEE